MFLKSIIIIIIKGVHNQVPDYQVFRVPESRIPGYSSHYLNDPCPSLSTRLSGMRVQVDCMNFGVAEHWNFFPQRNAHLSHNSQIIVNYVFFA